MCWVSGYENHPLHSHTHVLGPGYHVRVTLGLGLGCWARRHEQQPGQPTTAIRSPSHPYLCQLGACVEVDNGREQQPKPPPLLLPQRTHTSTPICRQAHSIVSTTNDRTQHVHIPAVHQRSQPYEARLCILAGYGSWQPQASQC